MPKIYLSPAYHKWNPCSIPGCDETTHNNKYLDELEVYLKANGIEYKRGPRRTPKSSEDGTTIMKKAVSESNAYKPDIHYVSHTNAANGTVRGYRPIIYPTGNAAGEKLAAIMVKHRKEIYNQPINIKRRDDLYELSQTSAVAYYEEHVFHDNKADAQWFHDNMRKIAEATCKGFCEYFGIAYKDPYAVEEKKEIYRVRKTWEDTKSQVGAYSNLQGAISKAQATQCNVYDADGKLMWEYIAPKVEQDEEPKKEEPKKEEVITEEPTTAPPMVDEPTENTSKNSALLELIKKIVELILKLLGK